MNKKVIAALLIIATAGITVLQGSYQAKRAQQRRTPTAKRQTNLARQKAALKKVTRPATPYKKPTTRPGGRDVTRKPSPAVPLSESIATGTQNSTQEMGTQTETPSLEVIIALTGIMEEAGVRLFQYATAIDQLKKDPLARLKGFYLARRGYVAIDKLITDIAQEEAIYQTNNVEALQQKAQTEVNKIVAAIYQQMLEQVNNGSESSLKNKIDTEVEKLAQQHQKALELLQKESAEKAMKIISTVAEAEKNNPQAQSTLETINTLLKQAENQ